MMDLPRVILRDCTVHTAGPTRPRADALAIDGGVVVALGSDETRHLAGWPEISLEGLTVMPGLVDAHCHLVGAATRRLRLTLDQAKSLAEVIAAMEQWIADHPKGEWIMGTGWDEMRWEIPTLPTRFDLDHVTRGKPAFLLRRDGHSALVNSVAMKKLRIDETISDDLLPKDAEGRSVGIIRENLLDEISCRLPSLSEEDVVKAIAEEQRALWAMGIVGVHTLETARRWAALNTLFEQGKLGLKVYLCAEQMSIEEIEESPFVLRPQGFKLFADGSLGSHTVLMLKPDSSGSSGVVVTDVPTMRSKVDQALQHELDVLIHAIGDRAVRNALNSFQGKLEEFPHQYFRIEHAQLVQPHDLARMAAPNLAVSIQPCHLLSDRPLAERLWTGRTRWAYAYRSMQKCGATLLLGTDFPIEPADPWRNMAAAMERRSKGGTSWNPDECLDWETVLVAYTAAPARLARWFSSGTLLPGMEANLVVVEKDPAKGAPWDQRVLLTMSAGREVFSDGSLSLP